MPKEKSGWTQKERFSPQILKRGLAVSEGWGRGILRQNAKGEVWLLDTEWFSPQILKRGLAVRI